MNTEMNTNHSLFKNYRMGRAIRLALVLAIAAAAAGFPVGPGRVLAQSARIVASIAGDWFWTTDFTGGAPLSYWIYASADPGAELLWSGSKTADEWGFILVEPSEHPVNLSEGHYLVVSDGPNTKALTLELVTIEVFDVDLDFVAGTAPVGQPVWVSVGTESEQTGMDAVIDPLTGAWEADFVVSGEAPLVPGYVLLRGPRELYRVTGASRPVCEELAMIHPDQPTRFLIGWLPEFEMTYPEALAHFNSIVATVHCGDGESAPLTRQEIRPFSLERWFDYACTWTVRQ